MIQVTMYSLIGVFCLVCAVAIACRPKGRHQLAAFNAELDSYPATLAPLPAPAELRAPRAIPDVRPPVAQLYGPPDAMPPRWRSLVDGLIAASWQSHLTMQRDYDIKAFCTVITALGKHQVSYV